MKHIQVFAAAVAAFFVVANAGGAESDAVVTFQSNATLTNSTEWTYKSVVSNANGYGLNSQNSLACSPEFGFCVTSVVLEVSATDSSTRSVVLSPLSPETAVAEGGCVTNTPPQGTISEIGAVWDASLRIRSFSISATTGSGNVYLKTATVSGIPLLGVPSNLASDAEKFDRVTLCWSVPEDATATDVEIEKDISVPFSSKEPFECDFSEISNAGGNLIDIDESLHEKYVALTGENVRAPTNTTGIVQLGTTDDGGWLLFSGVESYASAKLVVRARKHPSDPASRNKMPVFAIYEGVTNELGRIELSDEMADHVLDVAGLQGGTQLLLRSAPNKYGEFSGEGRVQVAFIGVAVSYEKSFMVGSACRLRVADMSPEARYLWRARSRGASGIVSPYTDWASFVTGDSRFTGGTVIVMQ